MSMFRVPDESPSPPSTPDPSRGRKRQDLFSPAHPSTTPLGPPPTSFTAASTTPAGPPPSSVFGSAPKSEKIPPPVFGSSGRSYISNGSPLRQPRLRAHAQQPLMDVDEREDDFEVAMMDYPEFKQKRLTDQSSSKFAAVARNFRQVTNLTEPDDFILRTESVIEQMRLYLDSLSQPDHIRSRQQISASTQALLQAWKPRTGLIDGQTAIGPADHAPPTDKASYLASLIVSIHNPPFRGSKSGSFSSRTAAAHRPIPQVLVQWLHQYHNPYSGDLEDLLMFQPNPTSNERYWDLLLNTVLRGDLAQAIRLLSLADFRDAVSSLEDGFESVGYEDPYLEDIDLVVNRAVQVLEACPAQHSQDWNVADAEWSMWRKQVDQAYTELETLADTSEEGLSTRDSLFGRSARRSTLGSGADSRIPRSIFDGLAWLYGVLLGGQNEATAAANDWLEATLGCAIWWDGEDINSLTAAPGASTRSKRRPGTRAIDMDPEGAYQDALAKLLPYILANDQEGSLQVNPTSPVEIGLACALEGDVEAFFGVLNHLSAVVSAATVEIASVSGWVPASTSSGMPVPSAFDASDLMVLSFAKNKGKTSVKDEVLTLYASLLSQRRIIRSSSSTRSQEGWQLAMSVLGRLDDQKVAKEKMAGILSHVDLVDNDNVEQVVSLCSRLGLSDQAYGIAERYADRLVTDGGDAYGSAILYYARGHAANKLRELLNYLISCAVIRSSAFPSPTSVDQTFQSLIAHPTSTINQLSRLDPEAASILSSSLAGYATLIRFYALRDGSPSLSNSEISSLRPIARKRAAADALVALIQSAADSIHGGLFDAEVASAVPVDALLCLLGEALAFLGDSEKRWFDIAGLTAIVTAAEDLDSAPSRVRESCEECFRAAIKASHGQKTDADIENMLKRSVSGLTAHTSGTGSSFEIIGSGILKSGSSVGSGLDQESRAWDWRTGFKQDVKGPEVLKILRYQIAKEMAWAWADS